MSAGLARSSNIPRPPGTGDGTFFIAVPNAFSAVECNRLCGLMDDQTQVEAGNLAGGRNVRTIRSCEILWLDDGPETVWLFDRLARLAADVNRSLFNYAMDGFDEGAQLIRYDGVKHGNYDWHVDRGYAKGTQSRKLSISVQITPPADYLGGMLELNGDGNIMEAPRALGTAIFFPSFVLHRVSPVLQGTRTALVAWLHGPAFR